MLVLTRRPGQSLQIGPSIELHVVRIEGDRVVLGVVAPAQVRIVRSELVAEVSDETREASDNIRSLRQLIETHRRGDPGSPVA